MCKNLPVLNFIPPDWCVLHGSFPHGVARENLSLSLLMTAETCFPKRMHARATQTIAWRGTVECWSCSVDIYLHLHNLVTTSLATVLSRTHKELLFNS